MTIDRFLLAPLAVGHLALFVAIFNVVHGLGYREHVMARAKLTLAGLFLGSTGLLGWELARGSVAAVSWPTFLYAAFCLLTGLVAFPLATAYSHLRPVPQGVKGAETQVDLAGQTPGGLASLVGEGKYAWMLRLPGNESLRLRRVEWELQVPGLPRALDGLTILHLSDLHFARTFDRRYFEAVVAECQGFESDIAVFTGDLVDDDATIDWIVPVLSGFKGRSATFAILGNHDMEHHPGTILQRLDDAGIPHLEGRWAAVEHDGATVAVGGTCYPWGPALVAEDAPANADYKILLSHAPDQFYWAERAGFDLMLSGHNHGGQIRLPLVGSVFMPSVFSRRFDRGFFRRNGLTLHVSQGIAGKHPLRYGCVPEVGRLTLKCAPPTQPGPDSRRRKGVSVSGSARD